MHPRELAAAVLHTLPFGRAAALLVVENVLVFLVAIAGGALLLRLARGRRVTAQPPPLDRVEIALTCSTLVLNSAVTIAGLWLARHDVIRFRTDTGWRALLDVVVLFLAMDALMYVLHRVAHIPRLFDVVHTSHHRYDRPRPLTLFVLNPAETLSFGALWLALLWVYDASWLGVTVYLSLNLAFGVIGHLGVEPAPSWWPRAPLLRHLAMSTFHAQHHQDPRVNFGFYTLFWDRLFGTLARDYEQRLARAHCREGGITRAAT